MYVILNGAFGVGKTAVARALRPQLPRAVVVDPEHIGWLLQRLPGYRRSDFQQVPAWRRLTVTWARMAHLLHSTVIIPMAFTELDYLNEVRAGLEATGRPVLHVCLTAPLTVIRERLAARGEPQGDARWSWVHRRAAECCAVHGQAAFAIQVPTEGRTSEATAQALVPLLLRPSTG